jgi:anthranilate phosphoribosyltransferase
MGKRHVIVVRGHEGLDEISASGPTRVLEYRDGERRDYEISPSDFGLAPLPFSAVSAASPDECLGIARAIIAGRLTGAHHQLVAINAAFVYSRFVENIPLPAAYEKMQRLIFDGVMEEVLEQYVSCMKQETVYV